MHIFCWNPQSMIRLHNAYSKTTPSKAMDTHIDGQTLCAHPSIPQTVTSIFLACNLPEKWTTLVFHQDSDNFCHQTNRWYPRFLSLFRFLQWCENHLHRVPSKQKQTLKRRWILGVGWIFLFDLWSPPWSSRDKFQFWYWVSWIISLVLQHPSGQERHSNDWKEQDEVALDLYCIVGAASPNQDKNKHRSYHKYYELK